MTIFGIGTVVVDHAVLLERFPEPDTKIGIGRKLTVGVTSASGSAQPVTGQPVCTARRTHLDYRYATHTVQSGDSIWSIARTLDTQSDKLRVWNDIGADKRVLSIGEQMHHAALTGNVASTPNVIRYRARSGDTLSAIADKFDVTMLALRRCNTSLRTAPQVRPGQVVLIPLRPS